MNKIIYGVRQYDDGENDNLMSASLYVSDSLTSESLGVDTLTFTVRDYSAQTRLLAADGMLVAAGGYLLTAVGNKQGIYSYDYGTPVYYYRDDTLIGKFYLEKIVRAGRYEFQFECVSAVGLLLNEDHYGGMYNGVPLGTVIADIIDGIVEYTVSAEVSGTLIFGWLPIAARRDNLRDLLFAAGAVLEKDTAGGINIVFPSAPAPEQIPDERIYMGGSVDAETPATGVDVTEHSFLALASDAVETLYDGEVAADNIITPKGQSAFGAIVTFSNPYHNLQAENGTILESGVNYAVLGQSPSCTLTGQAYTHTTRIVSRRSGSRSTPNIVTTDSVYLVNSLNSELVADRLMNYYSNAKLVSADLVMEDENPGEYIQFNDPFRDPTNGYIREMDIVVSGILKASCTIATNYTPTPGGNYYEHVMIITTSQIVTIPAECKGKIRAALIGGGHGGYLGNPGETGTSSWDNINPATAGGEPGEPGEGGRVFVVTMTAQPGQQFTAAIGTGGAGQTQTADAQEGGATTFGNYSSANGFPSEDGYIDVLNGTAYAVPGGQGIAGGHGQDNEGNGVAIEWNGVLYYPGQKGEDASHGSYDAYGGYGGGAAAGANGGDGQAGRFSGTNYFADGGDGGAGATPVKAPNGTIRGQGGYGGHGGGGGGMGGGTSGQSSAYETPGASGTPGAGGEGGDGAPGILLIYY